MLQTILELLTFCLLLKLLILMLSIINIFKYATMRECTAQLHNNCIKYSARSNFLA